MSTKYESANLILKLYELRRDETMRKARTWLQTFNPQSYEDLKAVSRGQESIYWRMVMSYWEMAATFVNGGAIDEEMFTAAHGEHLLAFSKISPYLERVRESIGMPQYLEQLERLIARLPDAEERLERMRAWSRTNAAEPAED